MQNQALQITSYSSTASLAFLIYDGIITLDDEIQIIWAKPSNSWIKWQFLFTRYFAIVIQLSNQAVQTSLVRKSDAVQKSLRRWFVCQVAVGLLLLAGVEFMLMARVYALYSKNRLILIGFSCLLAGEVISTIIGIFLSLPSGDFSSTAPDALAPSSFTYLGIVAIVSQTTILVLTLVKYRILVERGISGAPILSLLVRDGLVAFLALFLSSLATVVTTFASCAYSQICYFWFLSFTSSAGCRLIINLEHLPPIPTRIGETPVILTSVVESDLYSGP